MRFLFAATGRTIVTVDDGTAREMGWQRDAQAIAMKRVMRAYDPLADRRTAIVFTGRLRRIRPRRLLLASLALALSCCPVAFAIAQTNGRTAAEDDAVGERVSVGDWQFESIELKDGTVYQGLILAELKEEIEFVEIVRPPGKPMFAVVRPVATEDLAKMQRLQPPQRAQLLQRFARFRARARIEAGHMQDVPLRQETIGQAPRWIYQGNWFQLESTTDEEMTRRAVVRIEQIFRAYRQVLPPAKQPTGDLRILLFGGMEEYRRYVHESGFQILNPAFFSSAQNWIVAGCDLNAYAERLAHVRAHHAEVRRRYQMLADEFPARLSAVLDQMRRNGYSEAEVEQESRLRRSVWQREYDTALAKIEAVERQNEARFGEVTQQMFARLYHEAFHAYLDNYVYTGPQQRMPRWLNEGLAQIFESAQLDADTLRIDAPDPVRLKLLQRDFAGEPPLRVADVIQADDDDFLDSHRQDEAERLYRYAWGLAYFLTYEQNLLGGEDLDQYVANPGNFGPTARFTRLTGVPLPKFETAWRNAMLDLKPL